MTDSEKNKISIDFANAFTAYGRAFGLGSAEITEEFMQAYTQAMIKFYELGKERSEKEALKTLEEAMKNCVIMELHQNPKMSLKTFAKHIGAIPE